jgi:hypothetical protein
LPLLNKPQADIAVEDLRGAIIASADLDGCISDCPKLAWEELSAQRLFRSFQQRHPFSR